MIVAYCFHQQDRELALRNASHLASLEHQKPHRFLVGHDSRCDPSEVVKALSPAFQIAGTVSVKDPHSSWPASANTMFAQMAREMEYRFKNDKFFLWLEPDAIVLKENAFDILEQEYIRVSGTKKFMGALVPEYRDPKGGVSPTHLSGIAIYPNPLVAYAGMMLLSAGENVPFDLIAAEAVVQQSHFTDKIQHKWGRFNNDPPFTKENWKERITTECLIYHADKRGDLLDIVGKSDLHQQIVESVVPTDVTKPIQLTTRGIPKEGDMNNGMIYQDGGWRAATKLDKLRVNAAKAREAKAAKKLNPHSRFCHVCKSFHAIDGRHEKEQAEIESNPLAYRIINGKPVSSAGNQPRTIEKNRIIPWENKLDSLGEINKLAQRLYKFCDAPSHVHRVREELKKVGVIR